MDIVRVDPAPLWVLVAVFGAFALSFSVVSRFLKEKMYITEPLLSVIIGIIIGPYMINAFDIRNDIKHIHDITLIVLVIQIATTALEIPRSFLKTEWPSLIVLLTLVLSVSWMISFALAYFVVPGLTIMHALIVGASLAPTDPVLAHVAVKGKLAEKLIPSHVRLGISCESAINDGSTYPFYMIPATLMVIYSHEELSVKPAEHFFLKFLVGVILYEVVLGILLGIAIGFAAAELLYFATKKKLIEREERFSYGILQALCVLGITTLLGMNQPLATFASLWISGTHEKMTSVKKEQNMNESSDLMTSNIFFILFGTILPWTSWAQVVWWRWVLFVIGIILLRRIPPVLAFGKTIFLYNSWGELLFAGWNGPMGVAAVYYSYLALHRYHVSHLVWDTVAMIVFASVFIHGITSTPSTRLLSQRMITSEKDELYNKEEEKGAEGQDDGSSDDENRSDKGKSEQQSDSGFFAVVTHGSNEVHGK